VSVGGQDILAILVTITVPTLFTLLVATYRDQIKDLKEENAAYRREFPSQTQAIKDLTAAVLAKER
jgi:hypothetical protein